MTPWRRISMLRHGRHALARSAMAVTVRAAWVPARPYCGSGCDRLRGPHHRAQHPALDGDGVFQQFPVLVSQFIQPLGQGLQPDGGVERLGLCGGQFGRGGLLGHQQASGRFEIHRPQLGVFRLQDIDEAW